MKALLLIIAVLFSANSFAGVDEADAAYDNGAYKKAFHLFKKAAEQNQAEAQNNLGLMYSNGEGTVQDYKKAFHLYKKAAEQNQADAQFNLGMMYGKGNGTVRNYVRAHMWWNITSAQYGDTEAQYNLGIIENEMTSADISKAQNMARKCVASNYKDC